jgi:hypothetical protein
MGIPLRTWCLINKEAPRESIKNGVRPYLSIRGDAVVLVARCRRWHRTLHSWPALRCAGYLLQRKMRARSENWRIALEVAEINRKEVSSVALWWCKKKEGALSRREIKAVRRAAGSPLIFDARENRSTSGR